MKFKTAFWLFNIIVICAVSLFILSSIFILPKNTFAMYLNITKLPIFLFLCLLTVLDIYLIKNWNLFILLENQEWTTLLSWLQKRKFSKGHFGKHYVNLFIKTALVMSDYDAIGELEKHIRQCKPDILYKFGVSLGIPVLLDGKKDLIIQYFCPLAENPQTFQRDWAKWCCAFAHGLNAKSELLALLDAQDFDVRLLSFALLHSMTDTLTDDERNNLVMTGKKMNSILTGAKRRLIPDYSRNNHFLPLVLDSRINHAREVLLTETYKERI